MEHMEDLDLDLDRLEGVLAAHDRTTSSLIPILQDAQDAFGWLPQPVIDRIAEHLNLPASTVYGVVTFYAQFYLTRQGEHKIKVCCGTACHVRGSANIISAVRRKFGIEPGETTPDYKFTLERVACIGSCALAPVVVVDGKVYGQTTPEKVKRTIESLARK